jgi:molybdopterin-guanine dinucleotide biosynthesis protein A
MPFLDRNVILRMIEAYRNSKADALIPGVGKYIEPLHSIYRLSVTEHLEAYLKNHQSRAVRDYIELLKVEYIQFEESEIFKKAFTNINSPSDLDRV